MKPTDETYRERILKVQLFIERHLDEELSVDRLARVAHFSPFHFHRIFTGVVGEGVHAYVRRLRLEKAALLLRVTQHSIIEVALSAGYNTHEAFTRAFRQMFGMSPSQFRAGGLVDPCLQEIEGMTTTAPSHEVRIETTSPRRMAFVRQVGPYNEVGKGFERLFAWAGPRGLIGPGVEMAGVYLDDPEVTPPDKLRADCCITVGDSVQPDGEVGVQVIGGGEHAILRHRGPYSELADAYRWFYGTWLPSSGREPGNAPPFEVYRNSPADSAPEDLVTDIHMPLTAR